MNCKSIGYIICSVFVSLVFLSPSYGQPEAVSGPVVEKGKPSLPVDVVKSESPRRPALLFEKMLSDNGFIEEIGLSGEAVKNLRVEFQNILEKEKDLQAQRTKARQEQTSLLADALALCRPKNRRGIASTNTVSPFTAVKKVELETAFAKTEAIQHELNLLSIRRIILVRENLTDEQLDKANAYVREHLGKRKEALKEKKVHLKKEKVGGRAQTKRIKERKAREEPTEKETLE